MGKQSKQKQEKAKTTIQTVRLIVGFGVRTFLGNDEIFVEGGNGLVKSPIKGKLLWFVTNW